MKRALVSLPDELFEIMRTKLKGKFGQNDSEMIRGIVIAYLSEQGYLKNPSTSTNKEPIEETEIQGDMISAIVDTLEEKGIATSKEIDNKIRTRVRSKKHLTKLADLK